MLRQSNPQPSHRHIHFRKRFRLLGQCMYGGTSEIEIRSLSFLGLWKRIVRPQLPLVLLHTVHFARACGPDVDISVDLSLLPNHAGDSKQPEECRS